MNPAKTRRLSRGNSLFLLGMAYGSTIALLVVTVGFTTLAGNGAAVGQQALQLQRAGAGGHGGHGNSGGGATTPDIQIEARHVGNLTVHIKADVSLNEDNDPLVQAEVVAYTDMLQMRGVHPQGPLPMQSVPLSPGSYETTTTMSMPGDFEIRVVVNDPVQGEKKTTLPVNSAPVNTGRNSQYGESQQP